MWHSIYFILLHFSTGLFIPTVHLWWIENEAGLCHVWSRKKWDSLVVKVIGCDLREVIYPWFCHRVPVGSCTKVSPQIFESSCYYFLHYFLWIPCRALKPAEVNKTCRCGAALRIPGLGWLALYIENQSWRKKVLKGLSSGSHRFIASCPRQL